ncbi:TY-Chap domain-containing protein [Nocardia sp. R7R-8]|uniref:TY-Chap domain-containing protein n=1 Tax=Nocardia sp. R7R-8 TaxID=3459304 RepID=UPI00403D88B4
MAEFADGLTPHVAVLSAGTVVISGEEDQPKERRRFVQFRQLDTMIWAELPGDSRLAPGRAGRRRTTRSNNARSSMPKKPQVQGRFGPQRWDPIILLGTPVRVAEWQTR